MLKPTHDFKRLNALVGQVPGLGNMLMRTLTAEVTSFTFEFDQFRSKGQAKSSGKTNYWPEWFCLGSRIAL